MNITPKAVFLVVTPLVIIAALVIAFNEKNITNVQPVAMKVENNDISGQTKKPAKNITTFTPLVSAKTQPDMTVLSIPKKQDKVIDSSNTELTFSDKLDQVEASLNSIEKGLISVEEKLSQEKSK
jgi:hypothetical protein